MKRKIIVKERTYSEKKKRKNVQSPFIGKCDIKATVYYTRHALFLRKTLQRDGGAL